jgi:hypothetical protein
MTPVITTPAPIVARVQTVAPLFVVISPVVVTIDGVLDVPSLDFSKASNGQYLALLLADD